MTENAITTETYSTILLSVITAWETAVPSIEENLLPRYYSATITELEDARKPLDLDRLREDSAPPLSSSWMGRYQ